MGSFSLFRHPRATGLLGSDRVAFCLAGAMLDFLVLRVDVHFALLRPFLIGSLGYNTGCMANLKCARVVYFPGVVSYSIYLV